MSGTTLMRRSIERGCLFVGGCLFEEIRYTILTEVLLASIDGIIFKPLFVVGFLFSRVAAFPTE